MGEAKVWQVKYTWPRPKGSVYETAFGQILVEEIDFDRAVAAARKYFEAMNLAGSNIQSVENLGPLVVRL